MTELTIVYLNTAALKPFARNARIHSRKQIRQIADSIERFGFTNPLIIDNDNTILAGHGRLAAARLLGMLQIPCVRIESMSPHRRGLMYLRTTSLPSMPAGTMNCWH